MAKHSVVNMMDVLDRVELIHSLEIPSVEEMISMFETLGDEEDDNNKETYQRKELDINGMAITWKGENMQVFKNPFSIETLEKMEKSERAKCVYEDSHGNRMNRDELAQKIVDIIKWNEEENKILISKGRDTKGRAEHGNKNAEKYCFQEEYIYILYLLCGTMKEVGELLGIERRTVSKKIKLYGERKNNAERQ